jgi:hypothetical protein
LAAGRDGATVEASAPPDMERPAINSLGRLQSAGRGRRVPPGGLVRMLMRWPLAFSLKNDRKDVIKTSRWDLTREVSVRAVDVAAAL